MFSAGGVQLCLTTQIKYGIADPCGLPSGAYLKCCWIISWCPKAHFRHSPTFLFTFQVIATGTDFSHKFSSLARYETISVTFTLEYNAESAWEEKQMCVTPFQGFIASRLQKHKRHGAHGEKSRAQCNAGFSPLNVSIWNRSELFFSRWCHAMWFISSIMNL